MIGYIREINSKYISEFKNRIASGLRSILRGSDSMYLKLILTEINRLFNIISGRVSSRHNIPNSNDFPDTKQYNKLLEGMDIDIDKIYKAQELIESDVQNLVNFNSLEREKQINNLTRTQKLVYSAYIKSKKGIIGTTIIREDFKTDILTKECIGVEVNMNKEALSLATTQISINRNSMDTNYVECVFIKNPDSIYNIYPNNRILSVGSYWKRSSNDVHFTNKNDKNYYREFMTDDPNSSNVSSTHFEAVYTYDENSTMRDDIENELCNYFQLHPNFIMVDKVNALNGMYITSENIEDNISQSIIQPTIKLSIPFKINTPLTTSIIIDFEPNDSNIIPSIDIEKSFIQSNKGNIIKFLPIPIEKLITYSKTGRYEINLKEPSVPARADIVLYYSNDSWAPLKEYYMSGYVFEKKKVFELTTNGTNTITTTLAKIAWVFVDSNSNLNQEVQKANAVMKLTGVPK